MEEPIESPTGMITGNGVKALLNQVRVRVPHVPANPVAALSDNSPCKAPLGRMIMKDDWTVDNGLLTPTLKIKRHLLEEKYDALINNPEKGKLIYQS